MNFHEVSEFTVTRADTWNEYGRVSASETYEWEGSSIRLYPLGLGTYSCVQEIIRNMPMIKGSLFISGKTKIIKSG